MGEPLSCSTPHQAARPDEDRDSAPPGFAESGSAEPGPVHIPLLSRDLDAGSILDQFPDFIYVKDRASRFVMANASTLRAKGVPDLSAIIGRTDFDFHDERTARALFSAEQRIMETGIEISGQEHGVTLPDGRRIWLTTTKTPLREDGRIIGLVGISRDITERKRQEELRHGHARVLEMIARGQPLNAVLEALMRLVESELDGIVASLLLVDETGRRLRHGASASGLPEDYLAMIDGLEIGPKAGSCGTAAWRGSPVIVEDTQEDPLWEDCREAAARFGFRSCWSTPIMAPDGRVLGTFALYSGTVRGPTMLERELIAMATDLAGIAIERARNEERIRHMAHHDPLTGLPNRTLFWTQFNRALHEARRENRTITVTYIDLDNFKQINDSLGHAAGDDVLKTLSARMAACIRASDLLVRLGGDEFAIVFSNPSQDEEGVIRRLDEVRNAISREVMVEGRRVRATCSMGVSFFPQDGDTPEVLLARADRAMYDAKDGGRNRLSVSRPLKAGGRGF